MLLLRALVACLCLPGVVAYALPLGYGWLRARSVRNPALGTILVAAGTLLLCACVREFYLRGRGTLAPWSPPRELVVSGPYRYSRNPMYIAVLTILCGWATFWGSLALAGYAALVCVAIVARVRLAEEPWAERRFGAAWLAYRATVPRWFGLKTQAPGRDPPRR